ncbi:MAG: STAS domain-containing protein [Gallionellaceae bacterium]|nr:STAS domain-containing protein [Gallionellaceae bacterium]
MMRVDAGVAVLDGDLTLANASQCLVEGEAALKQGVTAFDMAGVGHLDSSALSLMLSLRRRAEAAGSTIEFRNIPDSLASLAKLYGVDEQI